MNIRIEAIQSATDMLQFVSMSQIQQVSTQDDHLQCLKSFIIIGWPTTKDELHADLKPYCSYRDKLAVLDRVMLKGRNIVIPTSLKQQVLEQLHTYHMGIEKTKLLACKSVYWSNINVDIKKYIKTVLHVLSFSRCSQRKRSSTMTYHSGCGKYSVQTSFTLIRRIIYAL